MTEELINELLTLTFQTIGLISAPVIVVTVVIGVIINVLQTVTQIRDPALSFAPKIVAAAVVIIVATPWYLQLLRRFFDTVMDLAGRGVL